ncbi:tol-pal system protein YbgF [Manganibacter manganicus]|uniref:Cell division coordinator CpoB n=1 Tax=Manganibacter manganicus TaxID=1873176 RepID=A0A1V8RPJ7_9HYPH|nr:tol-pal system protein YbgF [Pseudaminobacter manganicus]OQM75117.1 tol-pal system protein YbgF [Pseudaminobacter manganicus]
MYLRSILGSALAVLLLSGVAALANGSDQSRSSDSGFSLHLPSFGLPGVFGEKKQEQVQLAQQAVGATGLEDQIRVLNGKVEELNFQILQMQEQIRKQQEDNEFRFQQLEQGGGQGGQKRSDASDKTDRSIATTRTDNGTAAASSGGQTLEDIIGSGEGEAGKGAPPKTFGTITVDKNGNVVSTGGNPQADAASGSAGTASGSTGGPVVAALPTTDDPDELYRNSYQFILSGDYGVAEKGFRDHIARFPKDAKAADAHYWLGEALLGEHKYRDAAEVFLGASKNFPRAKKAPDMLFKLGVALVGLKQRDVACATFGEVTKRYPDISAALKERVKQERTRASC